MDKGFGIIQVLICQFIVQFSHCLDQESLLYSITEESPRHTFVCNLVKEAELAITFSPEELLEVRFAFLNSATSEEELFELDPVTGVLVTSQQIDRDVICTHQRQCDISLDIQLLPSRFFKIIKIQVKIIDINDNTPTFAETFVSKTILESSQLGTRLSLPAATDPDGPEYGMKEYQLLGGDDIFSLSNTAAVGLDDLQLLLLAPLDREVKNLYELQIYAIDGGSPSRNGTLHVEIQVLDVNDNSPRFDNDTYDMMVNEDVPLMSTILQVHAEDPDVGLNGQVVYGFSGKTETAHGDVFMIDENSGDIVIIGELDHEDQPVYTLYVTARDNTPNSVATHAKVIIQVIDLNDHAPEIIIKTPLDNGNIVLTENTQNNSFIAHVSVSDADQGQNGEYTCFLDSTDFSLEELYVTDYKITSSLVFDREVQALHTIVMTCVDKGTIPRSSSINLIVVINDENDQSPSFVPSVIDVDFPEANEVGARVTKVTAHDSDLGDNAKITYSLVDDLGGIFTIQPYSGVITCNVILDREQTNIVNLTVRATDAGVPSLTGVAVLFIHVTDIDDEIPTFNKNLYKFNVVENQIPGTIVGQVHAIDADSSRYNMFSYMIHDGSSGQDEIFTIDPQTGIIRTLTRLDRELVPVYHLTIAAKSETSINYMSTASVAIKLLDLNDNAPEIIFPSKTNHTLYVDPMTAQPGQFIAQIQAQDKDIDVNGVCEYRILSGVQDNIVSLDPYNGSLMVMGDLKLSHRQTMTLHLIVYDCGSPRMNATRTLNVNFTKAKSAILTPNAIIVIIICVTTLVVVAILIYFIIYVIRKRQLVDHKYNWLARFADHRIKTEHDADQKEIKEDIFTSKENEALFDKQNSVKIGTITDNRTIEGQESKIRPVDANEDQLNYSTLEKSNHNNGGTRGHKILSENIMKLTRKKQDDSEDTELQSSTNDWVYVGDTVSMGGDSGRESGTSGANTPSPGPLTDAGSMDPRHPGSDPAMLTCTPHPHISTWRLPAGIHHCDAQRLSSTLSMPAVGGGQYPSAGSVSVSQPPEPEYPPPRPPGPSRPPRQTHVRFKLPTDVSPNDTFTE